VIPDWVFYEVLPNDFMWFDDNTEYRASGLSEEKKKAVAMY